MRNWLHVALLTVALTGQAYAQLSVQASHIDGNVPPRETFAEILNRDLLAYFRANGAPSATAVEVRLLRDVPTQSGVAHPKYYAWVRVESATSRLAEGAVRVAAMERTHFEVLHYIPKHQANGSRELLESVFPRPLVPEILRLAAE